MSYERMWQEQAQQEQTLCDFPGCDKQFDGDPAAKCAAVNDDGKTVAFCKEHSNRLTQEGVDLRTINEIKEEARAPERNRRESERLARETAFIAKLKK